MNMTYEQLEDSEEKPAKSKSAGQKSKRKRSPSPQGKQKKGGKISSGKNNSKRSRGVDTDDEDDDLTADLSDPQPENSITEVKQSLSNIGKADMQPSKAGTYMELGGEGG